MAIITVVIWAMNNALRSIAGAINSRFRATDCFLKLLSMIGLLFFLFSLLFFFATGPGFILEIRDKIYKNFYSIQ